MDVITFGPTDHFVSLNFYLGPLVSYNKAVMKSIIWQSLSFHDIVLNIFFPHPI